MNRFLTGTWSVLFLTLIMVLAIGCSGDSGSSPVSPDANLPTVETQAVPESRAIISMGELVLNEEEMTLEVVPTRTSEIHLDVTWIQQWCPACLSIQVIGFDPNTRIFTIEMHTMNPSNQIAYDVRFILELDGSGTCDIVDPDNYTKLFNGADIPSPFIAINKNHPLRRMMPAVNLIDYFHVYVAQSPTPIRYVLECSFPSRCEEPYMISEIEIDGEFPPGGGGEVTVDIIVWDSQVNHGEIWLRTGGIFSAPGNDILMTPGAVVDEHGRRYSSTFQDTFGGGTGLTPVLIEAYTDDLGAEPYPLNDYARIFADPGGDSAIAGEVFNALTKQAVNGSIVEIHNTGGGGSPLPITVTDGTYYSTVVPGSYNVKAYHSSYFAQDTLYDALVPSGTTVYICFGLPPKYLDDPDEAMASISGHIRSSAGGDPIVGAQATLDGGSATGGIIQSRIADDHGHYCFYAVPTFQQDTWTVAAYHPAYLPENLDGIQSAPNKSTPQVDFDLTPLTADAVWTETFESGPSNVGTQQDWYFESTDRSGWPGGQGVTTFHHIPRASDKLWRVFDPITNLTQDIFYVNGECLLPPDDTSDGYLPEPFEGHQFLWYGEELDTTGGGTHSGSFIDEWNGSPSSSGGGTSSNSFNAGWAKTGPIDLTGYSELTLTLQSWWEIEAVDPAAIFDDIYVLISTDDVHWDMLDRPNPDADPIPDQGNWKKAYTSAGFNQAAVWSPVILDISSYGGNSEVWIRLDFDTYDPLYNGFRGWFVDDMAIWPWVVD